MSRIYPFEALPLAFSPASLEPAVCNEVTREHYVNHYMCHVDDLNAALSDYPTYQSWSLAKLTAFAQALPLSIRQKVAYHAGGCFNHELYWQTLTAYNCEAQMPKNDLRQIINQCFGDYAAFKNNFTQAALGLVGSGWVWLVCENKNGRLMIQATQNQITPLSGRFTPILALDMWEHAYYDQYQSDKSGYIDAWWQLIDWDAVDKLWKQAVNPSTEDAPYTLAKQATHNTSPMPYGCKSSVEATPAGESYYQHKHLNTFTNPCGGKSHAANSYYQSKSRTKRSKRH